jgi:hypothetical protein
MNGEKNLHTARDTLSSTYLISFLVFLGRKMLKTFRTVSSVLVVCGVGGIENRTAVLKKRVLTCRSGGGGGGAVASSCGVVCGVWCW